MTKQEKPTNVQDIGIFIGSGDFGRIVEQAADLTVVVDPDGIILSITVNASAEGIGLLDHWTGRNFQTFLTQESIPKFEARLAQARAGGESGLRPLELNHVDTADWEFPMRYTMHDVENGQRFLLLGRDMQPYAEVQQRLVGEQRTREREQQRVRQVEAKLRMVLEASETALVLVEPETGRIVDVNDAAARLLGSGVDKLLGGAFVQVFEGRRRPEFFDALKVAAVSDGTTILDAVARRSGHMVRILPQFFRAAGELFLLCRLSPLGADGEDASTLAEGLLALFACSMDSIVLTDLQGVIQDANDSFLNLTDATELRDVQGRPFSDFLARGGIDMKLILEALSEKGSLRSYTALFTTVIGIQVSVDISAARLGQKSTEPRLGFIIREVNPAANLVPDDAGAGMSREAMQSVMDLVGTATLKDLVSATTDVVEKLCIETALRLTENNRVAAADMLGLSRQSLYAKLYKHGLQERSGSSAD